MIRIWVWSDCNVNFQDAGLLFRFTFPRRLLLELLTALNYRMIAPSGFYCKSSQLEAPFNFTKTDRLVFAYFMRIQIEQLLIRFL